MLVRSAGRGALVLGPSGRRYLDEDGVEGDDPLAPFGPGAADDLRRLDAMPSIGDLVLNSRLDPGTDEVAAFEELVGSHGGLGGWQTEAFLLYPGAWEPPTGPIVGAPAVHRQRAVGGAESADAAVAGRHANRAGEIAANTCW